MKNQKIISETKNRPVSNMLKDPPSVKKRVNLKIASNDRQKHVIESQLKEIVFD